MKLEKIYKKIELSKMGGYTIKKIVTNPEILKGTDNYETIKYFIGKYKKKRTNILDTVCLDKNGLLYDGYHRVISAKIVGLKSLPTKIFTSDVDAMDFYEGIVKNYKQNI